MSKKVEKDKETRGMLENELKKLGVVDNSEHLRHTDFPMRDRVFNWIVKRYERNKHEWTKSDDAVWGGFIYFIWDWIVILAFLYLMWFIFNLLRKGYDDVHAIAFLLIMILFRLNVMIRKLSKVTG